MQHSMEELTASKISEYVYHSFYSFTACYNQNKKLKCIENGKKIKRYYEIKVVIGPHC